MKIGYARVSTEDQNLNRQIDALKEVGAEKIFMEKITGTKADRPELNNLLSYARTGDTVIVSELARLSRSTKDLISISEKLNEKSIELISLKERIDTTTATGKAMFGMLAVMAQFERDLIVERTREGLKAARARGRKGGRPSVNKDKIDIALTLWNSGKYTASEVAKKTGISRRTLFNYIKNEKLQK